MSADDAELIDSILGATDHYQVLGVTDHTCDAASLRRAYLRQCVKAHPDKNSDPRATTAFQKIAHAWQVLSDEDARAAYDARGCRDYDDNTNDADGGGGMNGQTYYAPPPPSPEPSFQEALFLFATVTSMMGGGGTSGMAGDVAQTLYWAERVLQGNRTTEEGGARSSTTGGSSDMQQKANIAMAAGSSLRVASAAAKMLGMKQSAAALDQTANMAQMAGVGAMVADAAKDVPAVRQALEQGGEKLQQLRGSMAQSGEQFQKLRSSVTAVQNLLRKDDRR